MPMSKALRLDAEIELLHSGDLRYENRATRGGPY
jgi:hypothetical protein